MRIFILGDEEMENQIGSWLKHGRLFAPDGSHPKLLTHAANPLPIQLPNGLWRILYCSRDDRQRSSVGAVDIDIETKMIVKIHPEPLIEHGPPGSFFELGISIGNTYEVNGVRYLLFMGWQRYENGWRGEIGRFVLRDNFDILIESDGPLISCSDFDTLSLSYPWVTRLSDSGYEMWYSSVDTWDAGNGEMLAPVRRAISKDGHTWTKTQECIPFEIGKAQAFSRPTMLESPDGCQDIWVSYRAGGGARYRIGHSKKLSDGNWSKPWESSTINLSPSGWDGESVEYPCVFSHNDRTYMLYCGNDYGKTGFGLAERME